MKIAFIVEDLNSHSLVYQFIDDLKKDKRIDASYLIYQKINVRQKSFLDYVKDIINFKKLKKFLVGKFKDKIVNFEKKKLIKKKPSYKNFFLTKNISLFFKKIIDVNLLTSNNVVYKYRNSDLKIIRDLNLDLIINFSGKFIRGEILNSSKLGVISFHNSDNRVNRGGPGGFWEVYYGYKKSGVIIQKLEDELDGGYVLIRDQIQTAKTWIENDSNLRIANFNNLKIILEKIIKDKKIIINEKKIPYYNRLNKSPNFFHLTNYLLNNFFGFKFNFLEFLFNIKKFLYLKKKYNVALLNSNFRELVMWKAKKISTNSTKQIRNSILISKGKDFFCFFDLSMKNNSNISFINYKSPNIIDKTNIDKKFNRPNLFELNKNYFLVSCNKDNNNEIYLFECKSFPSKWKLVNKIKLNFDFINCSTLLFQNKIYFFISLFNEIKKEFKTKIYSIENSKIYKFNKLKFCGEIKNLTQSIFYSNYQIFRSFSYSEGSKSLHVSEVSIDADFNFIEKNFIEIEPNFYLNANSVKKIHSLKNHTVFDFTYF